MGTLEVCLVKIGVTVQNISVALSVGEDSLVDARGMYSSSNILVITYLYT